MGDAVKSELDVLVEQLGELLADWPTDGDDALEVATVAGLAARLGATDDQLEEAEEWREGAGDELLEEGWAEAPIEEAVEAIESVCAGGASDEAIEEALFEFDELVAAAIWTDRQHLVRKAAKRVAHDIRDVPDVFVDFAPYAANVAKLEAVARDIDLYDYWLALAESRDRVEG